MIRICHVTTAHPADDVRIYEREARSLTKLGPDVEVIIAAPGSLPASSPVLHLELPEAARWRPARFAAATPAALRVIRLHTADIYHFHDPELLPAAIFLARRGETVIWDAHEDYATQFTTKANKPWVPSSVRRPIAFGVRNLIRAADREASAVVAATPTVASHYLNPRTVVVGNEARLEDFTECTPSLESRRVLFLGDPSPGHLFPEVVEAVRTIPGVILQVACRYSHGDSWHSAKAVLGERLVDLGWLDRQGLVKAISASAVGLVTYADTQPYNDGASTKFFEFAAAGLPVVCTPNDYTARQCRDGATGVVASGFTSSGISHALLALLQDPDFWQRTSDSARSWAQVTGGWQPSEARLLKLYRELLRRD